MIPPIEMSALKGFPLSIQVRSRDQFHNFQGSSSRAICGKASLLADGICHRIFEIGWTSRSAVEEELTDEGKSRLEVIWPSRRSCRSGTRLPRGISTKRESQIRLLTWAEGFLTWLRFASYSGIYLWSKRGMWSHSRPKAFLGGQKVQSRATDAWSLCEWKRKYFQPCKRRTGCLWECRQPWRKEISALWLTERSMFQARTSWFSDFSTGKRSQSGILRLLPQAPSKPRPSIRSLQL